LIASWYTSGQDAADYDTFEAAFACLTNALAFAACMLDKVEHR